MLNFVLDKAVTVAAEDDSCCSTPAGRKVGEVFFIHVNLCGMPRSYHNDCQTESLLTDMRKKKMAVVD